MQTVLVRVGIRGSGSRISSHASGSLWDFHYLQRRAQKRSWPCGSCRGHSCVAVHLWLDGLQRETDTVKLLKDLPAEDRKASQYKLQFVKQKVAFLGHDITAEGRSLSLSLPNEQSKISKPRVSKQVKSFLGMCSSWRTLISNYSLWSREVPGPGTVEIGGRGVFCFLPIATADSCSSAQSLRSPMKEMDARLLLCKMRPVAYFLAQVDPSVRGFPRCLRSVAAA